MKKFHFVLHKAFCVLINGAVKSFLHTSYRLQTLFKVDNSSISWQKCVKFSLAILAVARNVRRNLNDEMEHSGLLSTLSWIFNWKVPKVSHPRPMDVALNNYAHYTSGAHRKHFRKSSVSARNRKPWQNQRNKSNSQQKWSRRKRKHHQQLIQHRTSSSQNSSPYKFEQPLQYYDASQVYYYPSHKN